MVTYDPEAERQQICLAIGKRLRDLRKAKKLTLDVLAQKTGFSKSYLSQIENLRREPSIGTLTKVARILGVDALFLISGLQPDSEQSDLAIVRKDERKHMPDAFRSKGLKYESVAYKKKDRLMDAYIVEMGFDFPTNTKPWQGETFTYVLEGTHEFLYDGRSYILNAGDSYYFDPSKPYVGKSLGVTPSRVLVVFTFASGRKPIGRGPVASSTVKVNGRIPR
jgi:transcriptional regulator with XRE-family HTH domain